MNGAHTIREEKPGDSGDREIVFMSSNTAFEASSASEPRFFDAVETLSRDELQALQQRRLLAMVEHAYRHSPLVRRNWEAAGVTPSQIRSIADFKRLAPFTDKDQSRAWRDEHDDPFGGLLCCDPGDLSFIASSSGTTGDPTVFGWRWKADGLEPDGCGLDPQGPSAFWSNTHRDLWLMGARPGDSVVMLNMRIRGPVYRCLDRLGITPILISYKPDDVYAFIELSRRYRPVALFTASNPFVNSLENAQRELGIDMAEVLSSYKAVMFAGEPMGPRVRRVLESWNLQGRIYNQTAFGDIAVAHECPLHDGVHAHEDIALVELVDPETGKTIEGDGVGELCVTSLVNGVDPLIRYRSGDMVRLTTEPCGCGRSGARFWTLGRTGDEVVVEGHTILPMDVWGAVEDVEECSAGLFQVIRPARDLPKLRLRVGYGGNPDLDLVRRKLEASVKAAVGVTPELELLPYSELGKYGPRNKMPRTAKQ